MWVIACCGEELAREEDYLFAWRISVRNWWCMVRAIGVLWCKMVVKCKQD